MMHSQNAGSLDTVEPQDADYSYVPSLSDDLALLILARVPLSEHAKLCFVNQRYLSLLRNGELYKIRKEMGIREPSVFLLASGESRWRALDPRLGSCRDLPELPSDWCFTSGDKESFCVGTHLLVSGRELEGLVIWRYELLANRWFRGPPMIGPRCLFASASCGDFACVAGGIRSEGLRAIEVLNSAEKYNPHTRSWELLPNMLRQRKMCSGCYMDGKFYVIGGVDERNRDLTCGEFYDMERNVWDLVPDMINVTPGFARSPPLVAVVNNELYLLDAPSNQLKVYLKGSNSWRELGPVPVRADDRGGWGVAFKSLGNELLVMGSAQNAPGIRVMTICTCCPNPGSNNLQWQVRRSNGHHSSPFVFNCSVMVA
ncbi:F-box/kelch-repeat protein At3g27150 [Magnolia sinica]|uniref:F-box/kelch-repeat protein At3g27150 n=1 Tax=Magnolia sinica TaxID=86752 RepID=UPI002658CF6B|nr:F-box/kelch-repeat protein At3g27150 [Magnolia sinica]